jgi:sulfite exporter TauE/SafE
MAITARNPRRARLTVTLAGIILVLVGIPLWGTGDMDQIAAEQEQINNSAGYWGQEIGFDSSDEDAYNQAVADADSAETRMYFGIAMMILGVALVGSRWLIKPTTEK